MTVRPRRSVLYMPGSNPRALEKARGEVHTMIGTIRTAFDALKNTPPQQGLGAPVPAGAVPAARHPS